MVNRSKIPYLLLIPTFSLYAVFFIFPFFFSLFISFNDWNLLTGQTTLTGMKNYEALLNNPKFFEAIRNTVVYTLITTPISIVLGLAYAILIEKTKFLKSVYRFIFFVPVVISVAASTLSFSLLYNSRQGLINAFLAVVGIQGPNWLNEPLPAFAAIMILGVWRSFGYNVILYMAGIQQLDQELYEAADIDGTSGWNKLTKITIPLLSPVTYFVFVMTTLFSFQVFGTVQILTMGGPNNATNVLVFFVWREAFKFFNTGAASSAATILFLIMLVATVFMVRIVQKNVHYQ